MCSGTSESVRPLFLLKEREGGTESASETRKEPSSTEITGLERPEVRSAESRRHVTGDRNSCGGGRACL